MKSDVTGWRSMRHAVARAGRDENPEQRAKARERSERGEGRRAGDAGGCGRVKVKVVDLLTGKLSVAGRRDDRVRGRVRGWLTTLGVPRGGASG